ncbi:MAG TPA: RHS repeat domain-containing protein [Planctomycetota bacterium]|nr:RHS repeat domain-containing protein [Planctomycetota bacterium]
MKPILRRLLLVVAATAALALGAHAQSYTYDASGRLIRVTYPGGTTISYTFDAKGDPVATCVTSQPPGGGGGGGGGGFGCFVATAAYGSPLDPHVEALRGFRDRRLLTHAPGRALVGLYDRVSPPLAAAIEGSEPLRALARWMLAPLVYAIVHPAAAASMVLLLGLAAALGRRARRRAPRACAG